MKNRWKSTILGCFLAVSGSFVAAQPAEAAGFYTVGALFEHYNAGGASRGLFTTGPCDQWGYEFNPKTMYSGVANWAHIVSSIHVTGNGGCNSLRVYERTNPSVYWNCLLCSGQVVNLAAPFGDNVGLIKFFRTTSIVP